MSFCSEGWEEVEGTNKSWMLDGELFWNAGTDTALSDPLLWNSLSNDNIVTVFPARDKTLAASAGVGERVWLGQKAVSEVHTLDADASGKISMTKILMKGSGRSAKGLNLHDPGVARTASGDGTGVELGAATNGTMFNLHVVGASGTTPSLTVEIESDEDNTFASAATVGTFSAATAVGAQTLIVPGAETDTWYRATWTISGTSPSFLFVVSAGIY